VRSALRAARQCLPLGGPIIGQDHYAPIGNSGSGRRAIVRGNGEVSIDGDYDLPRNNLLDFSSSPVLTAAGRIVGISGAPPKTATYPNRP
jgi:hypothetical protein